MTPRPLRRRLACMSRPVTWNTRHTARILNRVGTHDCPMFPHHPSRRSCLCLRTSEGILLNAPHGQNTQSDRMFISFNSHPCDAKHRFHCVRVVAPTPLHMHLLWTWMCHHLGYPPRVTLLHGCLTQVHGVVCLLPQTSRMRSCVVYPPRVARVQNTQSDRDSFTSARRCVSYFLRCPVLTSFAGVQHIIFLGGSSVTGSCSTHSGRIGVRLRCSSSPHVTITVSG